MIAHNSTEFRECFLRFPPSLFLHSIIMNGHHYRCDSHEHVIFVYFSRFYVHSCLQSHKRMKNMPGQHFPHKGQYVAIGILLIHLYFSMFRPTSRPTISRSSISGVPNNFIHAMILSKTIQKVLTKKPTFQLIFVSFPAIISASASKLRKDTRGHS